jgi:hypothetical protein
MERLMDGRIKMCSLWNHGLRDVHHINCQGVHHITLGRWQEVRQWQKLEVLVTNDYGGCLEWGTIVILAMTGIYEFIDYVVAITSEDAQDWFQTWFLR